MFYGGNVLRGIYSFFLPIPPSYFSKKGFFERGGKYNILHFAVFAFYFCSFTTYFLHQIQEVLDVWRIIVL